jgi:hypothetical protein
VKRYLIEVTCDTNTLGGLKVDLGYSYAGDLAWVGLKIAARLAALGLARFVRSDAETAQALCDARAVSRVPIEGRQIVVHGAV